MHSANTGSTREPPRYPRLIGRVAELAALAAHVESGARVVSLVGPSGIGKSEVARAFADDAAEMFADVAFVELAGHQSAGDLVSAVASALRLRLGDRDVESALRDRSARGRSLLVLSRVDELVPEALLLIRNWLAAAPPLTCVLTSRVAPEQLDSHVVAVGPLGDYESLELFARVSARNRTGASDASVRDDGLATSIARCGHPLVIELLARAAPDERRRLVSSLTAGTDILAPAIRLEVEFCSMEERRALSTLALLASPFPLAFAEEYVGAAADGALPAWEIFARLNRRGLLVWRPGRLLALHSAVRAHVLSDLGAREDEAVQRSPTSVRLVRLCIARATRAEASDSRGDEIERARELGAELIHHVRAFEMSHATDALDAARLALALQPNLRALGRIDLLRPMLEFARSAVTDLDPSGVCRVHLAAAHNALDGGRFAEARDQFAIVATLSKGASPVAIASAILGAGVASGRLGEFERAEGYLDDAIERFLAAADRPRAGLCHAEKARCFAEHFRHIESHQEIVRARALIDSADVVLRASLHACELDVLISEGKRSHIEAAIAQIEEARRSRHDELRDVLLTIAHGRACGELGDLDAARAMLDDGARRSLRAGRPFDAARARAYAIPVAIEQRDFDYGRSLDRECRRLLADAPSPPIDHMRLLYRGALERRATHFADALESFRDAELLAARALPTHVGIGSAWSLSVRAMLLPASDAPRGTSEIEQRFGSDSAIYRAIDAFALGARAVWAQEHDRRRFDHHGEALKCALARLDDATSAGGGVSRSELRLARLDIAELLGALAPTLGGVMPTLLIGGDGSWFQLGDGPRVVLGDSPIGRMLLALARAHLEGKESLDWPDLVPFGWPEERVIAKAAHLRVRAAMSKLRKVGLDAILERRSRGYGFALHVKLAIAA